MKVRTILITGAAGNLGGLLAQHLLSTPHTLRLMVHKTALPDFLKESPRVQIAHADLAKPETLQEALKGVDTVLHFAGVLFAPQPERFLPTTNTQWFSNLLSASLSSQVDRMVLISFPHVEGATTFKNPATGRLDGNPSSVHARTRGEEERILFEKTKNTPTTPVSLRLGMVYGHGILMIDAARWLARHRLLGIWKDPTWIQLISTEDYLRATTAAATLDGISGIYHVGDEAPITLQDFFDQACKVWGISKPWRMPLWMIKTAARCSEGFARLFGTRSPLTLDFIEIGRASYWGDTTRFRKELLPQLTYPTFEEGKHTLL